MGTTGLDEPEGGVSPPPSTRRFWGWLGAFLVSALSVWAASAWTRVPPQPPPPPPQMTLEKNAVTLNQDAPQWQVLKLGVVGPANIHWTDPIPARVVINEGRAARVEAPLSGRITRVFVELGERVTEGSPLFSVVSPDISQFRAERERAAVDLDASRTALERIRVMVSSRALPAKQELEAERDVKDAEVALRLAESKLASLRVSSSSENEFTVAAPCSGVVVEKNVLPGQAVAPDASGSLMVVADLASVWVVADLFDMEASGIHEGTEAQITSPSLPEVKLVGTVEMVSGVVDPARHTVPVRVRLDDPERLLRPNVYARVRFAMTHREGALEIPASAIVTDGDKQYTYVQTSQGRFERRPITAGPEHDGRVTVLGGLSAGDVIVEEGAILLDNQLSLSD